MYVNNVHIFKYILSKCTGMPSMNFVCDHINTHTPGNIVLQTITVEFWLKLIWRTHDRFSVVPSSINDPFKIMHKCDTSKYSKLLSVKYQKQIKWYNYNNINI